MEIESSLKQIGNVQAKHAKDIRWLVAATLAIISLSIVSICNAPQDPDTHPDLFSYDVAISWAGDNSRPPHQRRNAYHALHRMFRTYHKHLLAHADTNLPEGKDALRRIELLAYESTNSLRQLRKMGGSVGLRATKALQAISKDAAK